MGKGFNNYMCKKFFHPGSIDNLKRVWMAQQKTDAEKKKQEELKAQYDKEQELYNNKALLVKGENKEKLSLNFMYEPPAGMKKEREREDGEPEFKFEWQRKYNGPRESYLSKDDDTIRDQPFGIQVRNVRCIKCKKWGHINTDKECELYTAPWELINPTTSTDPLELMRGMRDNGLALKAGVVDGTEQIPFHQLVASDDGASEEETEEMKFIKSLSQKDKLKLLKKLTKLQKKKKKKSKSKRDSSDSSSSSSDDDAKRDKKLSEDSSHHSERGRGYKRAREERKRHGSMDGGRDHKPRNKDSENRKKNGEDKKYSERHVMKEYQRKDRRQGERLPDNEHDERHHIKSERQHERAGESRRRKNRSTSRSRSPDRRKTSYEQRHNKDSGKKAKMYSDDEAYHRKIKREPDSDHYKREKVSEKRKKTEKRRHSSSRSRSPENNRKDSKRHAVTRK